MLQPQLLAALVDAKPFPGALRRSLPHLFDCFALAVLYRLGCVPIPLPALSSHPCTVSRSGLSS